VALLASASGAGTANAHDVSTPAISVADAPTCASASADAAGQATHHAGLVIVFDEQRTETRCVEFTEEEITGAELLRRSGLTVVFSGFGGLGEAVCRIEDVGCSDPGDCFCQCRGADCAYWAYFTLGGAEWSVSNIGPSQRRVQDGDMEAWVWGNGRTPPGEVPFGEVCPLPQARPTEEAPAEQPTEPAGASEAATATSPRGATVRGATAAATPSSAEATARSTAPSVVRDDNAPDGGGPVDAANEDGGSGAPVGLIAFGAVAGALVAGAGVLALRRRARG
jgi:hypothetical protein